MQIHSEEIPQADLLIDVIEVARAVAQGAQSYQDIAAHLGKVERQGRYYRRAAEILGFITMANRNQSVLTAFGQNLMQSGTNLNNPLVMQAVLRSRLFARIVPFIESHGQNGVTKQQLITFLDTVAEYQGNAMAGRRVSTVISWLEAINAIELHGNRYFLRINRINQTIGSVEIADVDEPIMPRIQSLQEYERVAMRSQRAKEAIVSYTNTVALERADNAHRSLVNLVSSRIRDVGSIPRYNQLIDLAARHEDLDFIFEMKSITAVNAKSQVRKGLSQLYEYRYLQNLPDSHIVLVIENPLPKEIRWITDYLEQDRGVSLIWDGDGNLHSTQHTAEKLSFLNIQAEG